MSDNLINPWLRLIRLKEFKKTLRVVPYNIARDSSYIYHENLSQPYAEEITITSVSGGEVFIDGFVIFRKLDDGKEAAIYQKSIQCICLMPGDIFTINLKGIQFVGI